MEPQPESPPSPQPAARPVEGSPGTLRSEAEIEIHTVQAQRLVVGRRGSPERPAIVGLLRFAKHMRLLWMAAAQDDPYADWRLLQIETALIEARTALAHERAEVERLLQSLPGISVSIAKSREPLRLPLSFSTPFGYLGAMLIVDFDKHVRALSTARHTGLMHRARAEQGLREAAHRLRAVFALAASGWSYTGITRADVRTATARAQAPEVQAMGRALGTLPPEVLAGARRAQIAPALGGRGASA
jgi:integrating conjugative element protein (TIGR03761 family)